MPGSERSTGWHGLVRSLRRWLPVPGRRPPDSGDADAADSAARPKRSPARPRRQRGARLLWCHADRPEELELLSGLLHQLVEEAEDLEILLTSRGLASGKALDAVFPAGVVLGKCPSEDSAAIRLFLDRNNPEICVWIGNSYAPNLIAAAIDTGTSVINVNAAVPNNIQRRARSVRRSLRQMMEQFHAVYATDTPSYEGLVRFGLPGELLRNVGQLSALPAVPEHDEALHARMGRAIGNRPVWLAFGIRPDELPVVLDAYRDAARLTHRLLLVLRPAHLDDRARFAELLAEADWSIAIRSDDQEPAYDTQVVLDDTDDELGLWLRVAPVAFLGDSLGRGGGTDPMPAAALGSAIVHGPFVALHKAAYTRLTAAGAAVEVVSAKSLAEAVCEISFPDRASAMAHAAWQVESEAAEVIGAVEQDILTHLNGKGAST